MTGAPKHSFTVALTVGLDFTLTSYTPSQAVSAPGQTTGPYNLTIQPVGSSFNAAITLSCSGLPTGAQCLFNPSAPVTPGASSASVVMTISTTAPTAALLGAGRRIFYALALLLLPGITLICSRSQRDSGKSKLAASFTLLAIFVWLLSVLSCSGVSNGGGGGGGTPTPPGTYSITITATSSAATHSTQVTLVVN